MRLSPRSAPASQSEMEPWLWSIPSMARLEEPLGSPDQPLLLRRVAGTGNAGE